MLKLSHCISFLLGKQMKWKYLVEISLYSFNKTKKISPAWSENWIICADLQKNRKLIQNRDSIKGFFWPGF